MKSLLLSLALCAGLAGCAVYPAYEGPSYAPAPWYDPNTGLPYYPQYAYPYAYPYGYWYPPVWFSGSWIWYGGSHPDGGHRGTGGRDRR